MTYWVGSSNRYVNTALVEQPRKMCGSNPARPVSRSSSVVSRPSSGNPVGRWFKPNLLQQAEEAQTEDGSQSSSLSSRFQIGRLSVQVLPSAFCASSSIGRAQRISFLGEIPSAHSGEELGLGVRILRRALFALVGSPVLGCDWPKLLTNWRFESFWGHQGPVAQVRLKSEEHCIFNAEVVWFESRPVRSRVCSSIVGVPSVRN